MNRKKTNKYILKGILIGIIVFVLMVAIGGFSYYHFYFKPNISLPIQNAMDANKNNPDTPALNKDILLQELENVLREEDVQQYLNMNNPNQTNNLIVMLEDARNKPVESTPTAKPNPSSTVAPTSSPNTKVEKSGGSTYDKLKDKIEPKDLSAGLALAGKIDTGYVLGLVSGGLTPQEKSELKKYLMARLSSSEISRGIQLFAKYSFLM